MQEQCFSEDKFSEDEEEDASDSEADGRARTKVGGCGADGKQSEEASEQEGASSDSAEESDDESEATPRSKAANRSSGKSTAGNAGGKRQGRPGQLYCSGCQKQFDQDAMYPSTAMCRPCKKAYDAIYKLARKQKKLKWWRRVRSCPQKKKQVFAKFKKVCSDLFVGRGKNRSTQFSIAHYISYNKAFKKKAVHKNAPYMTETDFMGFAMALPPHGWGLSTSASQTHWQEIVENKKNKPIWQRRGGEKVKTYPVTQTISRLEEQGTEVGKELQITLENKKKATDSDVRRMKRKVHQEHDDLQDSADEGFADELGAAVEAEVNAFDGAWGWH